MWKIHYTSSSYPTVDQVPKKNIYVTRAAHISKVQNAQSSSYTKFYIILFKTDIATKGFFVQAGTVRRKAGKKHSDHLF